MTDTLSPPDRPSRRALVAGGASLLLCAGGAGRARAAAPDPRLWAGTYAREGGGGLTALRGTQVGAADPAIRDASFGVHDARHDLWWFVEEASQGHVAAWRIAGGRWTRHARLASGGADPCHLALDPGGRALAVANYSSGTVALVPLDPRTGLPAGETVVRAHHGSGPVAARQEGPHAHWVGFVPGGWLHAVDLGADQVIAHRFDPARGTIDAGDIAFAAPAGSGPRHLAPHPHLPVTYLVAEIGNVVMTLRRGPGARLSAEQTLSTLPDGWSGASQAAHIAVDRTGRRLYVSNRGHDSIAVFAIDPRTGRLSKIQTIGTGGSWPRFFLLAEESGALFVANERAGEVRRFALAGDGRLATTDAVARLPGTVFLGRAG